MSYVEIKGNLFNSKASVIGNTVNCVGVMGKGIALEFRRRYPAMFKAYKQDCEQKNIKPGHIYYYPVGDKLILNIATKDHWLYPSKMEWIKSALEQFTKEYRLKQITSIALPLLGAQSGGLNKSQVQHMMRSYLQDLEDISIEVYDFDPSASDPLFNLLKDLSIENKASLLRSGIGITQSSLEKMIFLINTGSIQSMSGLAESKVLGGRSLDKLYAYLMRQLSSKNINQLTQGKLF